MVSKLDPVLLLLFAGMMLCAGMTLVVSLIVKGDQGLFTVFSGLLTAFSGSFFTRIKINISSKDENNVP